MTYAGFWKRFAAFFIDMLLFLAISWLLGGLVGFDYGVPADAAQGPGFFSQILGILVGWAYFAGFETSSKQGTPGKIAMGIKVTDMEGNRIGLARATGRHFAKILSSLILLIGYIMVAFTPRKQGLHDMLAGCLVVNRS